MSMRSPTPPKSHSAASPGAPGALALACLIGCNASSARTDHEAAPSTISAGAATGTAAPVKAPPAPSASPVPATGGLSGSWTGSYDAKKGAVVLPPKVKDKTLSADDGKASVGPGSIEITVLPSGEVRGKLSGALGAGTVAGRVEGTTIRAAVRPEDPQGAGAMSGVLLGEKKGEIIAGELRVAGPDATVIRTSTFELKQKL